MSVRGVETYAKTEGHGHRVFDRLSFDPMSLEPMSVEPISFNPEWGDPKSFDLMSVNRLFLVFVCSGVVDNNLRIP